MSAMTDFLESALCNAVLRGTPYTGAAAGNLRLGLFVSSPTETGSAGTEVSYSGYARQPITFGALSGGVSSNDAVVTFPALPNGNPTITATHWGLFDGTTGGANMILYGALTTPKTLEQNDQPSFPIGSLQTTWN